MTAVYAYLERALQAGQQTGDVVEPQACARAALRRLQQRHRARRLHAPARAACTDQRTVPHCFITNLTNFTANDTYIIMLASVLHLQLYCFDINLKIQRKRNIDWSKVTCWRHLVVMTTFRFINYYVIT